LGGFIARYSEFLCKPNGLHGMFQRPLAEFVSGQVITFAVGCSSRLVGVKSRKISKKIESMGS
jgi:hypothetical protein